MWLVSGAWPTLSWAAAVLTFTGFAGLSLYAGLVGRASCGCFGDHHVSPWYAFAVDVAAFGLLVLVRPGLAGVGRVSPGRWVLDYLPLGIGAAGSFPGGRGGPTPPRSPGWAVLVGLESRPT